ncbi:hypothetical protein A3H10_03670 [Candidatus Uhrbacteria bacterium RIFCSPLOWO2_12_FULL_46_10]|uniref:Uncharacterized protein n=1 Tax=Candidatus Uhrbacteria bacterium RIFCSPLOWO2_01_FULL_47_25 TaxID=1802402 RepID=A0A1F7UV81_9BACT|nr:MAG: hypothetical protein UX68_C0011G0047 [Parcubacteria group bacterium GW2011_GWA2_46_9]OGL59086.1 MAG: hypothetical protein A2752_02625 [Candidatus Uhrbacteria bacterium RIFCSPHIGHO2_01_FULL_46_23]OGL68752.1 MAG: hypothetical protein A3D60_02225 [Candidatus Uhrbacteria bacterium RIFCSPHIGHO2_02_FULL_47_29]OGL74778.1 MAG: hypothetical protein A3E96_03510 [Candidatus Uhrbacteria bacterium RIFCSPHIGHO2_12_FULL_46_13]OGL82190.1 MAG: hypothetical protein A2936_01345 [Candidatus Uhrbacteria bac
MIDSGRPQDQLREGSSDAIVPDSRAVASIPDGVDRFEMPLDKLTMKFGLREMWYDRVDVNDKPEENPKYVEGTILYFDPGQIDASIKRRDLTPAEINQVGVLAREIDKLSIIVKYLPTAIDSAEQLLISLRPHAVEVGGNEQTDSIDKNINVWLSQLGIMIEQMQTALVEKRAERKKLIKEVGFMGAVQLRSKTGGLSHLRPARIKEDITEADSLTAQ